MILGKHRTPAVLFVAGAVVILCLVLTFVWAQHHKAIPPATAPLHEKK